MRAIIGHSDDPRSANAIAEVMQQISDDLGDDIPRAGMLTCSADYEVETLLDAIQGRWPGLPVMGSTSDGAMSSRRGFFHDSVLLTVFSGDDLKVHVGLGERVSESISAAVEQALEGCTLDRPTLCFTTPTPTADAAAIVRTLSARLGGSSCPILGGLSGDYGEFLQMKEFLGSRAFTDSLPVLVLQADLEMSWGAASGWQPTGKEMTVTKSEGHVVHTIDGEPALAVFERNYEILSTPFLGEFPLEVQSAGGDSQLRACMSYSLEDGTMLFGGAVEEGSKVRFTEVLKEGLLKGSEDSLTQALGAFQGVEPELAMFFSCAGRKRLLGTEAHREIEVLKALAEDRGLADLALAGFYCFGEIAPNERGQPNAFHNETCISVVIGR